MGKILISVDDKDRVVSYRDAKWIVIYDMDRKTILNRVEKKNKEQFLDLLIEMYDPIVLLTTRVTEEELIMIESEGVKVVLVKNVDLRSLINELF